MLVVTAFSDHHKNTTLTNKVKAQPKRTKPSAKLQMLGLIGGER